VGKFPGYDCLSGVSKAMVYQSTENANRLDRSKRPGRLTWVLSQLGASDSNSDRVHTAAENLKPQSSRLGGRPMRIYPVVLQKLTGPDHQSGHNVAAVAQDAHVSRKLIADFFDTRHSAWRYPHDCRFAIIFHLWPQLAGIAIIAKVRRFLLPSLSLE